MSLSSVTIGGIVVLVIVLTASTAIAIIDSRILEANREMDKLMTKLKSKHNIVVLDCIDGKIASGSGIRYFVLVCNNTLRSIIPFSKTNYPSIVRALCRYTSSDSCRFYAIFNEKTVNNVLVIPNVTVSSEVSKLNTSKLVVTKNILPGLIYDPLKAISPIPNTMWKNNYFTINIALSFYEVRKLVQEYPYLTITTTSNAYYEIMQINKLWNNIHVSINSSIISGLGNTVIIPWTTSLRLIVKRENSSSKPKIIVGDNDEQYNFTLNNTTTIISVDFYTPSTQGIYIDLSRIVKANITILTPSPIVLSNNSVNNLASLVKITYYASQVSQMPIILPLLSKYQVAKQPLIYIDYPLMSKALQAYIGLYDISITDNLGNSLTIKLSESFKAYILKCNGSTIAMSLTIPRYAEIIAPGTIYVGNTIVINDTSPLRLIDFKKLDNISATIKINVNAIDILNYAIQPPLTINVSWDPAYAELIITDNYGTKYTINALDVNLPYKIFVTRGAISLNITILNISMVLLGSNTAVYQITYNISVNLVKPVPIVGAIIIENAFPSVSISNKTVSVIERRLSGTNRGTYIYYIGLYKVNIRGRSYGFTMTIQCLDNRLLAK